MSSQKLESIKLKYPGLSRRLDALAGYIADLQARGADEIEPALAARFLGTTEAAALALLMLLEEEGLLKHVYNIYCSRTRSFVESVDEKSEVPRALWCRLCDAEHADPDDMEVELAFRVLDAAWEPLHRNVAYP
jgi:hypothetical protein